MPRLTKLTALLLAALWLPTTLHCRLEALEFGSLFACATEASHSGEDDCADDACQTVESGQYAVTKTKLDLSLLPALACTCFLPHLTVAPPVPAPEISARGQEETLSLQRTWQFARRAALPARAPDALNVVRA